MVACILAEFIVGLSAMHSGWFPAFATTLIFLIIGILIGFPPVALALLVGFIASGGPAFADGGFDFRTGWLLRGLGKNVNYELLNYNPLARAKYQHVAYDYCFVEDKPLYTQAEMNSFYSIIKEAGIKNFR